MACTLALGLGRGSLRGGELVGVRELNGGRERPTLVLILFSFLRDNLDTLSVTGEGGYVRPHSLAAHVFSRASGAAAAIEEKESD